MIRVVKIGHPFSRGTSGSNLLCSVGESMKFRELALAELRTIRGVLEAAVRYALDL